MALLPMTRMRAMGTIKRTQSNEDSEKGGSKTTITLRRCKKIKTTESNTTSTINETLTMEVWGKQPW